MEYGDLLGKEGAGMSGTTQQVAHTPGPWRISGAAEGKGYSISAKRGLVALVRDDTHPLADVAEGQAQANAHLIAAAPELLEALKLQEAVDEHVANCEDCCEGVFPELCKAGFPIADKARLARRAAISKAETGQ